MNIYVETNFILELAFEQEQCDSCEQLLTICESGAAKLTIPAYCLVEPHEKLTRQARSRRDLQQHLDVELRQLARSASYSSRITSIQDIASLLTQSNEEEVRRFSLYRDRVLIIAEIIPLTSEVLRDAGTYEVQHAMRPQDAIVYASVIGHLRLGGPPASCFLNRNTKDFDIPGISEELAKLNCALLPRFDHGLGFVKSRITP